MNLREESTLLPLFREASEPWNILLRFRRRESRLRGSGAPEGFPSGKRVLPAHDSRVISVLHGRLLLDSSVLYSTRVINPIRLQTAETTLATAIKWRALNYVGHLVSFQKWLSSTEVTSGRRAISSVKRHGFGSETVTREKKNSKLFLSEKAINI